MSDSMIKVNGLGKKYTIFHEERERYTALRDVISNKAKKIFGKRGTGGSEDFWALKNINFEIGEGEAVGIIGRNGAGKSTLLKVLSRITEPSTGRIEIRGRVASLLEVGTGFHPELSGRENIFLNGAILGMSRAEIKHKFDEIVDFSGVEKFLDTPVKRYSSGMYVRLAFAVAAHLEPEILIVDEVLAVGDAEFQKKCLGKMNDVSKSGRTVLFVSHNLTAISNLCNSGLLMNKGEIVLFDSIQNVIDKYNAVVNAEIPALANADLSKRLENFQFRKVYVSDAEVFVDKPFLIMIDFETAINYKQLHFEIQLLSLEGTLIFETWSFCTEYEPGAYTIACEMPADFLNDSTYVVSIQAIENHTTPLLRIQDVLRLEVKDFTTREIQWFGKWPGLIRPMLPWHLKK